MIWGVVVTTDDKLTARSFEAVFDDVKDTVGGWLEMVRPQAFPPTLCMLVDEDGRLKHLPTNPVATVLYGERIVGTAVICGVDMSEAVRDFIDIGKDKAETICRNIINTFPGVRWVQDERSKEQ